MLIDSDRFDRKKFLFASLATLGLPYIFSTDNGLFAKEEEGENAEDINVDPKIKSVVFINMEGGMSHVDTLDPKANSVFSTVSSSISNIQVLEPFVKTAAQLKHIGIIRSTWSEDGDHGFGQYLLNTGYRSTEGMGFPDIPHIGSVIAFAKRKKVQKTYFPSYVTMGGRSGRIGNSGFLGIPYAGFHIGNLDQPVNHLNPSYGKFKEERLVRRKDMLNFLNEEFGKTNQSSQIKLWAKMVHAAEEFRNSDELSSFDLKKESEANQMRYGKSWQGKACLLAKRLVERETPFIQITIGGWDTHGNNKAQIAKIMSETDAGLAALIEDLAVSGLLNQTIFFLSSEFGRTPDVGSRDGRDHYPKVWTSLLGGGNLPRGFVLGESDKKGESPLKGSNAYHLRDLIATLYLASGVDAEASLTNSFGRPFLLVSKQAKPLDELMK
ncbi:hypothetical protein LPTSP4_27140 [Leptospira ryugenii]|uniref:DUF1501 domain-containing protein n=1 Tax=Leptospira ryugenii TaxID=1917863 RepID=A0A2P2E2R1_9LEPT|nr:DUF1501 domain-containing protein [Leptospira ryugenii]GBF51182.1 hypothetical protein LPTSP4_27140 [Leptospira ryugenii]